MIGTLKREAERDFNKFVKDYNRLEEENKKLKEKVKELEERLDNKEKVNKQLREELGKFVMDGK